MSHRLCEIYLHSKKKLINLNSLVVLSLTGAGYGNLCPLDNSCHVADTQGCTTPFYKIARQYRSHQILCLNAAFTRETSSTLLIRVTSLFYLWRKEQLKEPIQICRRNWKPPHYTKHPVTKNTLCILSVGKQKEKKRAIFEGIHQCCILTKEQFSTDLKLCTIICCSVLYYML